MKKYLLSTSCLSVLFISLMSATTASAADAPPDSDRIAKKADANNAGTPANVTSATPVPTTTEQDIVVTATGRTSMAGGGMIAVQEAPIVRTTVGQGFIAKQSPLGNTLAAIRLAPGVNATQDNPFGVSERSDLTVRGIGQTQMGFVTEGIPAADPTSYLPNTSELIDTENSKSTTITQGTSDLDSPVLSASGGLISVDMRDPTHEVGGTLSLSGGSERSGRGFGRFDTGEFAGGWRAYVSYSYAAVDNWRGPGRSKRQHVDLKLLRDWDSGSRSELFLQFNDLRNMRMTIPTLAQFQQYGAFAPAINYTPNYAFGQTQYFKFWPFQRQVVNIGAPQEFVLSDKWSMKITPYFRYIWATGPGSTVLNPNAVYEGNQIETASNYPYVQNGQITVQTLAFEHEYEPGVIASTTYATKNNKLTFGAWIDALRYVYIAPFIGATADGSVAAYKDANYLKVGNGTTLAAQDYVAHRMATAVFAQDEFSAFDERLKITAGVKGLFVNVTGTNNLPGATPHVGVSQFEITPRLGATFKIGEYGQIFGDLVTNARPPAPATTYFDAYNVATGKPTLVGNQHQKAEYSFQQEVGYRYQSQLTFSIAAFHNVLTNHQVNTITNQNGALLQSAISAGSQENWGANVELGLRPWHNLSPYLSGQYLHAETLSDIQTGNDVLPTKGKTAVRSPHWQGSAGLTYDDGALFAVVTGKYVSSQYSTFMADQKIPHYTQFDLGVGYRFQNLGFVKHPTLQVNITNLGNKAYLGSVASPTLNALPTIGRKGTMIAGSQPGYYLAAPLEVVATLKVDF